MKLREKYDLQEVFLRLKESRLTRPGSSGPSLRAFESQSAMSVLESALIFDPLIPEEEKPSIIRAGVFAAARTELFNRAAILAAIGRAESEYLKTPLKNYVVASSFGMNSYGHVEAFVDRRTVNGAVVSFRAKLPKTFDRSAIQDGFQEHVLNVPNGLTHCLTQIRSRTSFAAYHSAIDRVDLLRGIWNFQINSGTAMRSSPNRRPINAILLGPFHTVHNLNGSLATETYWYEPEVLKHDWMLRIDETWARVERFTKSTQSRIRLAKYGNEIENAFVRYVRALDMADPGLAFIRLWAVLELLVSAQGEYDKLIARVSFFYSGSQREFVQALLRHLKDVRNGWVHSDVTRANMERHVFELKAFVEMAVIFHLRNGRIFSSIADASTYLDTPKDPELLRQRIAQYRRALKEDGKRF